jgi:putative FmdB family regulatory protein
VPTYEYRCEDGHLTEEFRRVDDRDMPVKCGCGRDASRIISSTSFSLKGQVWARDGYAKQPGTK